MKKYRLLRVVLHFLLINGLFFLTYKLRLIGDFLPWIHLPIPFINADELCLFSLIASASFVSIWVIKSFYPLNKKIINHFQTLNKVWIYWFISIAFLSYFWKSTSSTFSSPITLRGSSKFSLIVARSPSDSTPSCAITRICFQAFFCHLNSNAFRNWSKRRIINQLRTAVTRIMNLDIQKKKINPCQKYERKAIEINQ